MTACKYQKYYSEYIRDDLAPELDIEFYRHLQSCKICELEIEKFYPIHRQLQERQRTKPDPELISIYHQNLRNLFTPVRRSMSFTEMMHELIFTHSRWLRLAEIAALLIIGVLLGRILFDNGESPVPPVKTDIDYYGRPISKQDMEYLNYYFLASEMVLLEMVNGDVDEDDFFLEKETAQKLLIKTFMVHEVALKLNDPKILRFLTRMELILYELSNAEQDQLAETLSSIKFIIDEAKLLSEVRELKQLIASSGTPESMPG